MANKKQLAFLLLDLLRELTDEDHTLIAKDIQKILEERCGFAIERRTLYSNIRALEDAGYYIEKFRENGIGYRLKGKRFRRKEVLLICRAVEDASYISKQKKEEIVERLLQTQSKYDAGKVAKQIRRYREQKRTPAESVPEEEAVIVLFRCEKALFDKLKISFGNNAYAVEKEGKCYISVRLTKKNALFLAQKYLGSLVILEPPDLKNEFAEKVRTAAEEYQACL